MSTARSQQLEWRFSSEDDVAAWLRAPAEVHVNVLFREPTGMQWHSIMTVTGTWVRKHAEESRRGAIWPALLVVPDGSRAEIEQSIAEQLRVGWRLIAHNERGLSADFS